MKKRLNEETITNELRGASKFFPVSDDSRPQAEGAGSAFATAVSEQPNARPSERPNVRPAVRRAIARHSFEFFQDQYDALKRLALEEQLDGRPGSMSEMVREAVDTYIAARRGQSR